MCVLNVNITFSPGGFFGLNDSVHQYANRMVFLKVLLVKGRGAVLMPWFEEVSQSAQITAKQSPPPKQCLSH